MLPEDFGHCEVLATGEHRHNVVEQGAILASNRRKREAGGKRKPEERSRCQDLQDAASLDRIDNWRISRRT